MGSPFSGTQTSWSKMEFIVQGGIVLREDQSIENQEKRFIYYALSTKERQKQAREKQQTAEIA